MGGTDNPLPRLPVILCQAASRGEVVWGGAVSLVTTSLLVDPARRTRQTGEDGRPFRATFVDDTADAPAYVEDSWVGEHRPRPAQ